MKEQFNRGPGVPKARIEDIPMFGKLLARSRSVPGFEKSRKELSIELGLNESSLQRWEKGEAFPEEKNLADIAKVYNIDLAELTKVFNLSKAARELEKKSRF